MTNLDKWKEERIKEIEDMDTDKAVNYIDCLVETSCNFCAKKDMPHYCGVNCKEGIKAYLDMEVNDD